MRTLIASFLLAFFLASCAAPTVVPPTATLTPVTPTATLEPSPTATQPTATETPTPEPEKFDAATWSTMDATARQAEFDKLPATTAEGYTKGEVSAVKDYLQKYYDPKTKELVEVFDFETGKYETPEQAGIIEFDLTDGGKYEMRSFKTAEEALAYIEKESFWYMDKEAEKRTIETSWFNTSESYAFVVPIKKIPGWEPKRGFSLPSSGGNFFEIKVGQIGNGTGIILQDREKEFESIYLEVKTGSFIFELDRGGYTIPTPQP